MRSPFPGEDNHDAIWWIRFCISIEWCVPYLKEHFMYFIQWDLKTCHPVAHPSWSGIFLPLTLSIRNSRKEFATHRLTGRKIIFNFGRCPLLWSPEELNLDHSQSLEEANITEHISSLPPFPILIYVYT